MCNYDKMLNVAEDDGLEVIEKEFKSSIKGLCKGKRIGIKKGMPIKEKACILAEELGHYHTTVGNIMDTRNKNNLKQERIARKWAVNKLISPNDLIEASKAGYEYISDIADYLDITDDFLLDAIEVFKSTYGISHRVDNYIIHYTDFGYNIECLDINE